MKILCLRSNPKHLIIEIPYVYCLSDTVKSQSDVTNYLKADSNVTKILKIRRVKDFTFEGLDKRQFSCYLEFVY